jgi:hypothetical protein
MIRRIAQSLVLVCICTIALRAADDPIIGTWKLNAAKSKWAISPAMKSSTLQIENSADGGRKVTGDNESAAGIKGHQETTFKYDGKDYPLTGSSTADTLNVKQVDPRNTTVTYKKDGKVAMTEKSVISADGKTWTRTQSGKDAQGKAGQNVLVYEKQ